MKAPLRLVLAPSPAPSYDAAIIVTIDRRASVPGFAGAVHTYQMSAQTAIALAARLNVGRHREDLMVVYGDSVAHR